MEGADDELRLAIGITHERGPNEGPALFPSGANPESDEGLPGRALALRASPGKRLFGQRPTIGVQELEVRHELLAWKADRLARVAESHCCGRRLVRVPQLAAHVDDRDGIPRFL